MLKIKSLFALVSVFLSFQLVSESKAIELSQNGSGQVLLGPIFYVENGYTNEISLVNPRADVAVKVKMTFRSHFESRDIFHFILNLFSKSH